MAKEWPKGVKATISAKKSQKQPKIAMCPHLQCGQKLWETKYYGKKPYGKFLIWNFFVKFKFSGKMMLFFLSFNEDFGKQLTQYPKKKWISVGVFCNLTFQNIPQELTAFFNPFYLCLEFDFCPS